MNEIKFAKPVSHSGYTRCVSIGRNGEIQTHGIWVYSSKTVNAGEYISIQPITSRDNAGRCRIEFPSEEAINVARAILAAAGVKAAVVENPKTVTVDSGDDDFDVFSNVPGMQCIHYKFDSMFPESDRMEDDYGEDVDPLEAMGVEVRDQLTYLDEDERDEKKEN